MVTALIVEDEKLIRKGLVTMLRRSPLPAEKILEARNGEEALKILKEEEVDLMLTDVQMPKMNGIELVEHVKDLENPPIIVTISGYDEFSYAVDMLRNGIKDYLLKPVEQDVLNQCMERLCQPLQARKSKAGNHKSLLMITLSHYLEHSDDLDEQRQVALREIETKYLPQEYQVICGKFELSPKDQNNLFLKGRDGLGVCICPFQSWDSSTGITGTSRMHRGIRELPIAYNESISAWKQGYFLGESVLYQPVSVSSAPPDVSHLMDLLRLSRWKELLCSLQQGGRLVADGKMEPDKMFHLCEEVMNTIGDTYQDLCESQENPVKFNNIWAFSNWKDYLQELSQCLTLFCQKLDQKFADYENKKRILEAVQFVRANFCSSINMAMVSNQVSMNYSLFSVLFKQYTGTNFVTFLQNLRVEEAKRLLEETDLRVNEISGRVGFSGEKHFLKVFKSSVGVSPGDWRKLNRTKDL